jgi:hypothetical protein
MGKRHPNHRRVKIHRSYTVEDIAVLFSVHKNTVRNWVKSGLPAIDTKRPLLVSGCDLIDFLQQRKGKRKLQCGPGELYCFKCRVPRMPAENMVDYSSDTEKVGNLIGICPVCTTIMNRRVSLEKIGSVCGNLDITFPESMRHIVKRVKPTVNSDLR